MRSMEESPNGEEPGLAFRCDEVQLAHQLIPELNRSYAVDGGNPRGSGPVRFRGVPPKNSREGRADLFSKLRRVPVEGGGSMGEHGVVRERRLHSIGWSDAMGVERDGGRRSKTHPRRDGWRKKRRRSSDS